MLEIINYNTAPILQIRNATYPFAVTTIATIAILRNTEPTYNGQIITLLGHTTAGVGGGDFRYDASDTTTADDNGVTIVTVGDKRWKRILNDYDYQTFTASSTATSMASPLVLRDLVERKLNLDFTNPTLDGTINMSSRIQSLLDAAGADTRKGRREVVIQGKGSSNYVGIGTLLQIPSNVRLVFDGDITCVPLNQTQYGIRSEALYPTSWVNLSVDGLRGKASITVADGSSFSVGDQVIIKSNYRIDNCPNSYNATVGQQCTIWRKETNVLHLDTILQYDYTTSDTAQIGKIINAKKNIIIEGFKWGEDGRTIRGGNAISLVYVDGFKIIGTQIVNMRNDDNLDNSAKNGITLTGGRNGLISEANFNRVGWYGVTYQGCTENLIIEKIKSHWARHHISANWENAPHQPMDITIRDSFGTFSTLSGFDTHDVGLRTKFQRIISKGSQTDSGFQNRCNSITYEHCEAYDNFSDGFIGRDLINKATLYKCIANNNLRTGISFADFGSDLVDCDTNNNASSGRYLSSGNSIGGNSVGNQYSVRIPYSAPDAMPMVIDNLYAPSPNNQIYIDDIVNYNPQRLTLKSNKLYGFTNSPLIATPSGNNNLLPLTDGHNKTFLPTTAGLQKGIVTLSGGTATITTAEIRDYIGTGTNLSILDKVRLTVRTPSNAGALRYDIVSKTSFTITSTNASDASVIEWEITGF